jgi:pyruvate formate lyase activating enzyme
MSHRRNFIKQSCYTGCSILLSSELGRAGEVFLPFLNGPDKLWKWSTEAIFWEDTPIGVKCLVCPNECTLKPGEKSQCRNRINHLGKLYSIAYGNPCAVHVDPIEKKPLFHFFPGTNAFSLATAGCNFACLNCQNWTISQASPTDTKNADLMPEAVIEACKGNNCRSVAFTYSEPTTFFEYMYDTARMARSANLKTSMHSNGYINEKPLTALCEWLDAANIDLKSFNNQLYLKLSGGKLEPVLNTLKTLKKEGVWLEITNLIIPGWTDDLNMIRTMCKWLVDNGLMDVPLHFSRFMPQHKLTQISPTPVNMLIEAREIALNAGMYYVYIGNAPGIDAENTYCPNCKTMVIERKGYKVSRMNLKGSNCTCGQKIHGIWN